MRQRAGGGRSRDRSPARLTRAGGLIGGGVSLTPGTDASSIMGRMDTQPIPTHSNESADADILLRTTLVVSAVVTCCIFVFWASNDPNEFISEPQVVSATIGFIAALIGAPLWIALAIRTVIRALRH